MIPKVKKGEAGRVGKGRFNAKFEAEKAALKSGGKDKQPNKKFGGKGDRNDRGGFKKDRTDNFRAKKVGGGFKRK